MVEQMVGFFVSGFVYPGILWNQVLLGIGLAVAFGAVWFAPYWTPILKKPWAWAVLAAGAFLSWAAVAFIQIPLQIWAGQALNHFWSREVLMSWLLLAGIPGILLSGLVQEGSKLVPVVIYWWRKGKNIDPKLGLVIGAVAGLGLGVFEAVWVHNTIFASGWGWEAVQTSGLMALAGFWERFFGVAAHIAFSALVGWGLAKGWGWQFYLIASFLHGFLNYSAVLFTSGLFTIVHVEIYAAVVAVLVTAGALWLRWRKPVELAESEVSCA
jgi:RsiW-degrading membrane proteinase PrsW (M82 family)